MPVQVVAFDVNETLLDLRALDQPFERLFGDPALRVQWFAQMLQLSFVGGLTGRYIDFTTAQHAALMMLAERTATEVSEQDATALVARMRSLPPHPEVAQALSRLTATPLVSVALTNSPESVAEAQLTNAGLRPLFDRVFSADTIGRLKPAPEPYLAVASAYDVAPSGVRLVAAHSWDVTGAIAAGCRAAFVSRPGMVRSPIGPQPDITGSDIADVVAQILDTDTS